MDGGDVMEGCVSARAVARSLEVCKCKHLFKSSLLLMVIAIGNESIF